MQPAENGARREDKIVLQTALELLDNEDDTRRSDAIATLRPFGDETVRARIRDMLYDPWAVVRIEAIEYLEAWRDRRSIPLLLACLRDEDDLVRRYAACALGILHAREIIPLAQKAFAWPGCTDNDRLGYNFALLHLGEEDRLLPFLDGFFSEQYQVRCATAHMVTDFIDEESAPFILSLLETLSRQEEARAVRSTYEETMDYIRENIMVTAK